MTTIKYYCYSQKSLKNNTYDNQNCNIQPKLMIIGIFYFMLLCERAFHFVVYEKSE